MPKYKYVKNRMGLWHEKRPAKAKTLKKKIQKEIQKGVTNYKAIRPRSITLKKAVLSFPYTALLTLATPNAVNTEVFQNYSFRINSIFDPDQGILGDNNITVSGFQHIFGTTGVNHVDGQFAEWTVLKAKTETLFISVTSNPIICATWFSSPMPDQTFDYRTLTNGQKWYKERVLTDTKASATIKSTWDACAFTGDDVRDSDKYKGKYNMDVSNPISMTLLVRNFNKEAANHDIQIRLKINYIVECTAPRQLEQGV